MVMSDLALRKTDNQNFDIDFDGVDLLLTNSLTNCVAISLLCHSRETINSGAVANIDPVFGGWWADALSDFQTGSLLWTLFRGKCDNLAVKNCKKISSESLQWLIDDGVAKEISVDCAINGKERLDVSIDIKKPDGSNEDFRWQLNWEESL